jgi:hypothetical protein
MCRAFSVLRSNLGVVFDVRGLVPYSHVMIGWTKKLLCFSRLEGVKNYFSGDWKDPGIYKN